MRRLLHSIDLHYALLPDDQIEAMWRYSVACDPEAREPVLRQLVLRAARVLDETCRHEGESRRFTDAEHERAYSESAQRLMSRLRVDPHVRDIRALAHQIARDVVADPGRRRAPRQLRFAAPRQPRLRLVLPEDAQ